MCRLLCLFNLRYLRRQVCERPESAELQSWEQHWAAHGEAEVLRTWTEKYRDYIDPAYLEAAQDTATAAPSHADGGDTSSGVPECQAADGEEGRVSGVGEDQDSGSVSAPASAELCAPSSEDVDENGTASAPGPNQSVSSEDTVQQSSRADQPGTGADVSEEGQPQFDWSELWQRHYQEVYDQMLAAFTDRWGGTQQTGAETERRTGDGTAAEPDVTDGRREENDARDCTLVGEPSQSQERLLEEKQPKKNEKKKKMSSKKAR